MVISCYYYAVVQTHGNSFASPHPVSNLPSKARFGKHASLWLCKIFYCETRYKLSGRCSARDRAAQLGVLESVPAGETHQLHAPPSRLKAHRLCRSHPRPGELARCTMPVPRNAEGANLPFFHTMTACPLDKVFIPKFHSPNWLFLLPRHAPLSHSYLARGPACFHHCLSCR